MRKILLISLVLALLVVTGCSITGNSVTSTNTLAKCLTEKKVVMYGTEWCSHCQNQKKAFGNSIDEVTFIDCDKEPRKCDAVGIQGYTTWRIDGQNYPGEQQLSRLASLSGCKL